LSKKVLTDVDIKRKAIKLVISHLKKKLPSEPTVTQLDHMEHILGWISEMESLLEEEDFEMKKYINMRKDLNDVIERTLDETMRFKLRDSWYSLGKAMAKKVEQK